MNIQSFNRKLQDALGANIRVHQRSDGFVMLENLFKFPDGDHFPIYVSETKNGNIVLSDQGHTLMHISYEHDIDSFYKDPRKESLLKQIVLESKIKEKSGVFSVESKPDDIVEAIFRFGQSLTKIYDITFLKRESTATQCNFYEQLEAVMSYVSNSVEVSKDYIPVEFSEKKNYMVDYRFNGKDNRSVFVYGIHNRNKAQRTTITLSQFLLNDVSFTSILVLKDETVIPKIDLGFLRDAAGSDPLNIRQKDTIQKKIEQLVA